jgi:hypothetical protein
MFAFFGTANASLYTVVFDNDWTVQFDSDDWNSGTGTNYIYESSSAVSIGIPGKDDIVSNSGTSSFYNYTDSLYSTSSDRISFSNYGYANQNNDYFTRSLNTRLNSSVFADGMNLIDSLYVAKDLNVLWDWSWYSQERQDNGFTLYNSGSLQHSTTIASISSVPVPGAVWLMGTALIGLVTRRKLV